ncbi:hypothetical protein [Methylobacterium aquaticum]|nr:hypothetical protein [Methylobacterium aquaticum]
MNDTYQNLTRSALLYRKQGVREAMSEQSIPSRHVVYAERYATGSKNHFNAFSALQRARLLWRETQTIIEMFEEEGQKEEHADWYYRGLEIVPYTLVGLATCLEWHARSRLTDLYTFKPEAIDRQSLDGKVHPKVLPEMIKANVSIPQLLGVSFTVGSFVEYVSVFDKLFNVLSLGSEFKRFLKSMNERRESLFGDDFSQPSYREEIEQLYSARHALVHEIGFSTDFGQTLCQAWSPSRIASICGTVIYTIEKIENHLTMRAVPDFPNLLTIRGDQVDRAGQLLSLIRSLENDISKQFESRPNKSSERWRTSIGIRQKLDAEYSALFKDDDLFRDPYAVSSHTSALYIKNLEQHLEMLKEIHSVLNISRRPRFK